VYFAGEGSVVCVVVVYSGGHSVLGFDRFAEHFVDCFAGCVYFRKLEKPWRKSAGC